MATYKVIQDIEAEDKLVGPLTLRQFIYAGVAAVSLYICFLAYTKNAAFLMGFFLPIAAVSTFFAFPWKGEQPTEIWALARIRFSIKPRVRIWDQDGAKDLVTITVPKVLKDLRPSKADLSQSEVRSRLKALADTIDSRGWATRNAAYGIYGQQWVHPTVAAPIPGAMAAAMPVADDMFDASSSVSQNFDAMLNKSSQNQRQRVMQQMAQAQNPTAYQQPVASSNGGYQLPQLPNPMMPSTPTPNASSAYEVAPAPVSPQMNPLMGQAFQPGKPAQPGGGNNHWFANGPAFPANPTPSQFTPGPAPAAMAPTAGLMAPVLPTPTLPQPIQPSNMNPVTPMVESDMPLPASANPTDDELALGNAMKQQSEQAMSISYNHMRVLQPASGANGDTAAANPYSTPDPAAMALQPSPALPTTQAVTRKPDPAILELANNDDLDIATIARQANKEINKSPDEVEIRLH